MALNFNIDIFRKKVLVAPLDWGLGHATRCIPLINHLLRGENEIIIAADGPIALLLRDEFPELRIVSLPGYRVTYSRKKAGLAVKLIHQLPHIIRTIRREHQWLAEFVKQENPDIIISDNRPGLYHTQCHSIYITHQLLIKTPLAWLTGLLQKIHYRYLNRFNECWIPDWKTDGGVAGELSHPQKMPQIPVHYIGPLSRFTKFDVEKKFKLAAVLSGPEPQRSLLEEIILEQLKKLQIPALVVRGVYQDITPITPSHITIVNHLSSSELNRAILQAEIVISRSGYSTIMDLVRIGQRAILVPTPGQTEQEYLAQLVHAKMYFYSVSQQKLNLEKDLQASVNFLPPQINYSL